MRNADVRLAGDELNPPFCFTMMKTNHVRPPGLDAGRSDGQLNELRAARQMGVQTIALWRALARRMLPLVGGGDHPSNVKCAAVPQGRYHPRR